MNNEIVDVINLIIRSEWGNQKTMSKLHGGKKISCLGPRVCESLPIREKTVIGEEVERGEEGEDGGWSFFPLVSFLVFL